MEGNVSATISQASELLVSFGQRMVLDRLVVGSAGNISMRVGDFFFMTPSGINYDQIAAANICQLDGQGTLLAGDGRRSSEWPMHRKIYDSTAAQAVVHTHSPFAAAVSTVCREIPAIHYSVLRLGGPTVPVVPYTTFGSAGLADLVSAALADRTGALLENHGAVVCGASLAEAYDRALLLEWLAEVYWRALLVGSPRILDATELDDVREAAKRHRYQSGGA
ncbi:MAG: class II aldolase/adducin family protein [Streptosporangiaceae bacterium]